MKRTFRFLTFWVLVLVLTISALALPQPTDGPNSSATQPATGTTLVLQGGASHGLLDGRLISLGGSRYAENGALLVPLERVVSALGGTLSQDGNAITLQYRNRSLTVTPDNWWAIAADGSTVSLPTPPVIMPDDTLYVPSLALTQLGWTVHSTGYYEGDLTLISRSPLTESRQQSILSSALRVLGPNPGLFQRSSLLLRLDSRWSVQGGKTVALSDTTNALTPYRSGTTIQLPLAVCAQTLGYTATPSGSGYTVTGHGKTLNFSAATVSTETVTLQLGGYVYTDAKTGGILLSAYPMGTQTQQRDAALETAGKLTLLESELVKGYIALTFDDGPSGSITTTLLDGLKARDAHATFFLCNYRIGTFPGAMSRYLAEGHEVANHSATHADLAAASSSTLAREIDTTNSTIASYTGVTPTLLRPPGGSYDSAVLSALKSRGMSCVLWSLDPMDWKLRNTEKIVQAVVSQVEDGDVVLLHDMSNASVQAALQIIDIMQAKGYRFVTVSELAQIKGVTLQPGQIYYGFTD